MDSLDRSKISVFDQVKILTTKNVTYLSAPPGTNLSPQGVWSVAAAYSETSELLCVRNNVTIKIPVSDVFKIVEYDLSKITGMLGKLSYGQIKENQ